MKNRIRSIAAVLLAMVMLGGMTGCAETTIRSSSYGSSNYQPYDYYYYPQSRIYLNVATGYYFYPYKNNWRKVRSLPRQYHLNHHDRVTIRVKSKDRPYSRHHIHRKKYAPRRYYRDTQHYRNKQYYRDKYRYRDKNKSKNRDRNRDKQRTKIKLKKSHNYYYYPKSRVYYNAKTGEYFYLSKKKWKRSKRIPPKYRLRHNERVTVKVATPYKPYLKHSTHRARYEPRAQYNTRAQYNKNKVKTGVERFDKRRIKDY